MSPTAPDRSRRTDLVEPLLLITGTALLIVGLMVVLGALMRTASGPLLPDPASRGFAVDFRDYWLAAGRMAQGQSPYAPEMLTGPISSIGLDRYRYPPVLAFLLIPLSGLPYQLAGAIFAALSVIALMTGLVLSMRAGGYKVTPRRLLFVALMTVWFFPTLDMLAKGNVEGLQALLVGIALFAGRAVGASAVAAGALLKLTPAALLPAAFVRDPKAALVGLVGTCAILVIPSFILTPQAYIEMPAVLANIAAGDATSVINLMPASWLSGDLAAHAPLVRAVTLVAAGLFVAGSIVAARRPDGYGAAVACGVIASMLAGNVIWIHYAVLLLPLVVFAWPRLTGPQRVVVEVSLLAMVMGGDFAPLLACLAALVMAIVLAAIWPQRKPSSPTTERQTLA